MAAPRVSAMQRKSGGCNQIDLKIFRGMMKKIFGKAGQGVRSIHSRGENHVKTDRM
jgi:hypothetical protein